MNKLHNKIADLCRSQGISLKTLAEKADIPAYSFSSLYNEYSYFGLEKLYKICKVLQVSVSDMLEGQYFSNLLPSEKRFLQAYYKLVHQHRLGIDEILATLTKCPQCIHFEEEE